MHTDLDVYRLTCVQIYTPCSHAKVCLLSTCIRPMRHATYLSGQVILSSLFMVQSKHQAAVLVAHCQTPQKQQHVIRAVI